MRTIRDYIRLVEEANFDPASYWNPGQIDHIANYTSKLTFKSPEEAREWYFRKLQHWDKQSWAAITGVNGPEKNRLIADSLPIYQSGKSFKIGKRIRAPKKTWDDIEIKEPSIAPLVSAGWLNPFDGYKVLGIQMKKVSDLHMTEDHSNTEGGQEKVHRYAQRIKDDETFLAIIVDTQGTILDGHHRYRAVRDVLKWKTIPCLVVWVGDGETDLEEDVSPAPVEVEWSSKHFSAGVSDGEYVVVWVDIPKFEEMFQRDEDNYVGPGGSHNAIGNRYRDFGRWLNHDPELRRPREPGQAVLMPHVYVRYGWVDVGGEYQKLPVISFGNGRHRYSWMRDHGARAMPVIVPADEADDLRRLCGTSLRSTRIH